MAIIKKSDTVKITYDQKKIVLKSDTITMEVDMGMAALMSIYASGSGEGKAVYSVKVPDAPAPVVAAAATTAVAAEPTPAPAAPPVAVPVPAEPKPEPKPVAEEIPIVVLEGDKDAAPVEEPTPVVEPSEPVEHIDDIIREANGEVPATEPDAAEPDAPPVVEADNSGWETVTEEAEADTAEEVTHAPEPEEDESREQKYRGFASKTGWTDTP